MLLVGADGRQDGGLGTGRALAQVGPGGAQGRHRFSFEGTEVVVVGSVEYQGADHVGVMEGEGLGHVGSVGVPVEIDPGDMQCFENGGQIVAHGVGAVGVGSGAQLCGTSGHRLGDVAGGLEPVVRLQRRAVDHVRGPGPALIHQDQVVVLEQRSEHGDVLPLGLHGRVAGPALHGHDGLGRRCRGVRVGDDLEADLDPRLVGRLVPVQRYLDAAALVGVRARTGVQGERRRRRPGTGSQGAAVSPESGRAGGVGGVGSRCQRGDDEHDGRQGEVGGDVPVPPTTTSSCGHNRQADHSGSLGSFYEGSCPSPARPRRDGGQTKTFVHPSPTGVMKTVVSFMDRWSQTPSMQAYSSSS